MRDEDPKRYFVYKIFDEKGAFWRFEAAEEGWAEKHQEYIKIPEKLYLKFDEASQEAIVLNEEVQTIERKKRIKKV